MNNYRLLVDVWEAETNLDYAALIAGGVDGVIIRLNDMNGGHHMDANFIDQWYEAGEAGIIRAPYFVYNPWVTGAANHRWLMEHLPDSAGRVFVDIEVTYPGYSAAKYAGEVVKFLALLEATNPATIYTGQWFLNRLTKWPVMSYWWAQYMNALYPNPGRVETWEHVKEILATMPNAPTNSAACVGVIKMWQISGDRLILPGSAKPIDVNCFFGALSELREWFGGTPGTPPPVEPPPVVVEPPVVVPPIVVSGAAITKYYVPLTGTWWQVLHDYEKGLPRSVVTHTALSKPETVPLLNRKEQFFPLSAEWQAFWLELMRRASLGKFPDWYLLARWAELTPDTLAFTDGHAVQNGFTDFNQGLNLGSERGPVCIKSLITGGAVVKEISKNGTKITIECLNFSKAPPSVDSVWLHKPWLYFWATSEYPTKLADGTYLVRRFPQLAPFGTPVLLGSWDGTQVIERANVKKLLNGKTYRIYNP